MRETWDQRIRRARQLAARDDPASSLLTFYGELLALQKDLYDTLRRRADWTASGDLGRDSTVLAEMLPPLLRAIVAHGPAPLADEARELLHLGAAATRDMLLEDWQSPSDQHFFAKAVLQPYAQRLADAGVKPVDRELTGGENRCPFCAGAPQVSILDTPAGGDGPGRSLLCATCLTPWPFRRVVCAWCGEEDERKLAYFQSPAFDHLRLDTCETCRRYLKSVDRSRLGVAVPIVDEVAGAPLDLWARDRGYRKIELNLVGL